MAGPPRTFFCGLLAALRLRGTTPRATERTPSSPQQVRDLMTYDAARFESHAALASRYAARRTPHATGPATHVPMILLWLALLATTGHTDQGLSTKDLNINTARGWFAALFIQMMLVVRK